MTFFDRERFAKDLCSLRDYLAFIPVEQVTKQDIANAVVNRASGLPEAAKEILDMVEAFRTFPMVRQCETDDLFGELRPSGIWIRVSIDRDKIRDANGIASVIRAIQRQGELPQVDAAPGNDYYVWLTFPIEAPKGGVNG